MPPKQKLVQAKRESVGTEMRKRAQSEADWIAEELREGKLVPRTGDILNDAVGRTIFMAACRMPGWVLPKTRHTFQVFRYYFHAAPAPIAIDKPATKEEAEAKALFFADRPEVYVAVLPNEAMAPEELRERIRQEMVKKGRRKQPLAAPVVPFTPPAVVQAQKAAKRAAKPIKR